MNKVRLICVILLIVSIGFCSCEKQNQIISSNYSLEAVIFPKDYEIIGNKIPEWVNTAKLEKTPLYVATLSDTTKFDEYVKQVFPGICDENWTQEQSDNMTLGQGIYTFQLDDYPLSSVYYPVIYNGMIVSMLMIVEDSNGELTSQYAPYFANELNILVDRTTEQSPLYLCISNNNLIGIIGNSIYVFVSDYVEHKEVNFDKLKVTNLSSIKIVSAKNALTAERNKNTEAVSEVLNSYLNLLDEHKIDEAVKLLYFREENKSHYDLIKEDYTTWAPDIKDFKIFNIKKVNSNLCRIDSEYTNRSELIHWQPYVVNVNGEWLIVLNSHNIPNENLEGVIVGEDLQPGQLSPDGLEIIKKLD